MDKPFRPKDMSVVYLYICPFHTFQTRAGSGLNVGQCQILRPVWCFAFKYAHKRRAIISRFAYIVRGGWDLGHLVVLASVGVDFFYHSVPMQHFSSFWILPLKLHYNFPLILTCHYLNKKVYIHCWYSYVLEDCLTFYFLFQKYKKAQECMYTPRYLIWLKEYYEMCSSSHLNILLS